MWNPVSNKELINVIIKLASLALGSRSKGHLIRIPPCRVKYLGISESLIKKVFLKMDFVSLIYFKKKKFEIGATWFFFLTGAPAPNCGCNGIMVAAVGEASTKQPGKYGWYWRQYDENKGQYYWRRYRYEGHDAKWEDDAIWQVNSFGSYWYIGAFKNRFQKYVSLNTVLNIFNECLTTFQSLIFYD